MGIAPHIVTFTDESTGDVDTWSWDFDNDGTEDSNEQNPTYTYNAPGDYTVALTVSGPGGTDTNTKIDHITVYVPAVADFSASPASGPASLSTNFSDLSTGDVDTWSWDFDNDGSEDSTEQNPSYTYSTPGSYSVSLTVSGLGGSDSITKTGYITLRLSKTLQYNTHFMTIPHLSHTPYNRQRHSPGALV